METTPTPARLGEQHLLDRGLPLLVAQVNGIEIDLHPERAKTEERLGVGCVPLWTFATEVLWVPLYNKDRERFSWLARALPTIGGKPKFVAPTKNSGIPTGIPYIPIWVWHNIGKPVKPVDPLILTEGPMKALGNGAAKPGCNLYWSGWSIGPCQQATSKALPFIGRWRLIVQLCFWMRLTPSLRTMRSFGEF